MTLEQIHALRNGLYRVFWASGGMSVAAKGQTHDGSAWMAVSNWLNGSLVMDEDHAQNVSHVELITTQDRELSQKHVRDRCLDEDV